MKLHYIFFTFTIFYYSLGLSQTFKDKTSIDKLLNTLKETKDHSIAVELYQLSLQQENDSIDLEVAVALMQFYYKIRNWEETNHFAHRALKYANLRSHQTYKVKAENYLANQYLEVVKYDSAYYYFYTAGKNYKILGDSLRLGKVLLNMSIIEKNVHDYYTAMNTSIRAEQLIIPYQDNRLLGSIYNNLGIISNELGRYDQAIDYHKKALTYRKEIKNSPPELWIGSINNIAIVYKKKKQYIKAKNYLEKAIEYENLSDFPQVYATILDNLGHTYFLLGDTKQSGLLLSKALNIREENNDIPGKIVSYLHFADFYKDNNTNQAENYVRKAITLSKTINNQRDLISGLKFLALMESPDNKALSSYVSLRDSLVTQQNVSSLRLNRIKYESDVLIQEKLNALQLISLKEVQLKNRNIIIGLLASIVALVLLLIYWIYRTYRTESNLHHEFNHRVRNNLNHISYYILKLKKHPEHTSFKDSIKELETVIHSQQLLFSILEKNNTSKTIVLNEYLEILINHIMKSYPEFQIVFQFDMQKSLIPPEKASVVGIIINEFLTNAFKYGFNKKLQNTINITLKIDSDKKKCLQLFCSGKPWNPKLYDKSTSSGFFIMRSLAENMKASIDISFEKKSILQLIIP